MISVDELKEDAKIILEKMKDDLRRYVDEECADLIIFFFSLISGQIIGIVPDLLKIEETLAPRTVQAQLKSKLKTALEVIQLPEPVKGKIGECLTKLVKSNWLKEALPETIKLIISEDLKKLEKFEESKALLEIFHKACDKDLAKVLNTWRIHYPEKFDEFSFKMLDALTQIMKAPETFESKARNFLMFTLIISEAYYRRLISFLLDCIRILEGKEPKGKVRYLGKSCGEFESYKNKYPNVAIFFDKDVLAIRNAIAHADYEIDVENKKIIIKVRENNRKVIKEITEDDLETKKSYLIRMAQISLLFYSYTLFYLTKKIGLWERIISQT